MQTFAHVLARNIITNINFKQYKPDGRRPDGWYWSSAYTGCDMEKSVLLYLLNT